MQCHDWKLNPRPTTPPSRLILVCMLEILLYLCKWPCAYHQPYNEQIKATGRRRLSSPIINPNFEEDINATLTKTINMDDVLASLACVTLTSPDEFNYVDQRSSPVNHDHSVDHEDTAGLNYNEHEEVETC